MAGGDPFEEWESRPSFVRWARSRRSTARGRLRDFLLWLDGPAKRTTKTTRSAAVVSSFHPPASPSMSHEPRGTYTFRDGEWWVQHLYYNQKGRRMDTSDGVSYERSNSSLGMWLTKQQPPTVPTPKIGGIAQGDMPEKSNHPSPVNRVGSPTRTPTEPQMTLIAPDEETSRNTTRAIVM